MQNVGKNELVSYSEYQWYVSSGLTPIPSFIKKQSTCSRTKMRDGHAHTYIYTHTHTRTHTKQDLISTYLFLMGSFMLKRTTPQTISWLITRVQKCSKNIWITSKLWVPEGCNEVPYWGYTNVQATAQNLVATVTSQLGLVHSWIKKFSNLNQMEWFSVHFLEPPM